MKKIAACLFSLLLPMIGEAQFSSQNADLALRDLQEDLQVVQRETAALSSWTLMIVEGSRPIDEQPPFLVLGFLPGTDDTTRQETVEKVSAILRARSKVQIQVSARYRWEYRVPVRSGIGSTLLDAVQDDLAALGIEYLEAMLVVKAFGDSQGSQMVYYLCTVKDPSGALQMEIERKLRAITTAN